MGCSKIFKSDHDPEFLCGVGAHLVNVRVPFEVARNYYSEESAGVDDFERIAVGETQLRQEVILFAEVERDNLCFSDIYFHLVLIGKQGQVGKLVLKDSMARRKGEARS